MAWRRAVERSRLPSSVKLTLLAHSERGAGHFHDESVNEHAFSRAKLASRLDRDAGTIRRHYRRAEDAGYLVMHERGERGQPSGQGRGRQTVFHYVTPGDPWPCEACGRDDERDEEKGRQKGSAAYPLSAPLSDDQDAPPKETSEPRTTRHPPYAVASTAATTAVVGAAGHRIPGPHSPRPQPPGHHDPEGPAPAGVAPGSGPSATTDRARDEGWSFPASWRHDPTPPPRRLREAL